MTRDPTVPADGAPSALPVTNAVDAANDVQSLIQSPTLSIANTPVKPSISSTALQPSPSVAADGVLGLSALNLSMLLGLTADEAKQMLNQMN